jgi:membrane protease YdiL (CAAX protease family)
LTETSEPTAGPLAPILISAAALLPALAPWKLPWPLGHGCVVAAVIVTAFGFRSGPQRGRAFAPGRFQGGSILVVAALSGAGLLIWQRVFEPDLGWVSAQIPPWPWPILVLAGLAFSLANALIEESVYRGALWAELEAAFAGRWVAPVGSSLVFGLVHWGGVPGGAVGVALATLYGFALAGLRWRSAGLATPFAAHVLADAVIFGLVV